jgi:hypothetical protein
MFVGTSMVQGSMSIAMAADLPPAPEIVSPCFVLLLEKRAKRQRHKAP